MKIFENDAPLFKKLGIKNVLDLALILPKSFDDFRLSKTISPKENATLEVKILSRHLGTKSLVFNCISTTIDVPLQIVIFHPQKWHYAVFGVGNILTINAKVNYFNGLYQLCNPKIVTSKKIKPKYGVKGVKNSEIQKIIELYLEDNLKDFKIKEKYKNLLLDIHSNTDKTIEIYENFQNFLPDIKYIEIYNHLLKLQKKKIIQKSVKIITKDINIFLKNLDFTLTRDQLNAINDIKNDLEQENATRRVVMGDVGCGKTMVLLGAAFMCKKSVLLAPTTILCEQLYAEAKKYLPKDFKIYLVKSTTSKKQKILQEKCVSEANLVIGTHTLLYMDLKNIELLMIDEQHRFGSSQRQKLALGGDFTPHFVQFSATPIPRTLAMIQSQIVNFSFIKQMPFPKNITTFCIEGKEIKNALNHIKSEIKKGNQALIIYPLVNSSEKSNYTALEDAKEYYLKHFENVYFTHGKDKDKEQTLLEFKERGSLLVATSVVEVGISLPRLSVIVIVGAERFGLASLHQMRGRVGRVGLESFCYLYSKNVTPKRLIEFSQTLDGFCVAELDLKNRRSGDIVDGRIQHGEQFNYFNLLDDETILQNAQADLKLNN